MSDLSAQFFHSEDLFCISTLSHGRHTSKAKSESHSVIPTRVSALRSENVEYNTLTAGLKEVTLLLLGND